MRNFPDWPHQSLEGVLLLCKHSVLPSIPKSGLSTPPPGLRDLEVGLDQDWWLHVLVNPSENDVITTERDRQKKSR